MEVIPAVRFPKIFSPRVLIRDSNRVNDFDLQPTGFEPRGLTLSVQCWQSPIKSSLCTTFIRDTKRPEDGYRDSTPEHEHSVTSFVSPCIVRNSTPDHENRAPGFLPSPRFRSGDLLRETISEVEHQYKSHVPSWHWLSDRPQDLSVSGTTVHPAPSVWETRGNGGSPAADDLSKMSSAEPSRSCGGRFKGKMKIFKCPYCVITCSNRGQLLGHIRIHTGERPFVCQEPGCKKAFIRNEELTRHRRIHTGERPYICDTCKKAFTRKDHLNKHVKIHSTADDIFSV